MWFNVMKNPREKRNLVDHLGAFEHKDICMKMIRNISKISALSKSTLKGINILQMIHKDLEIVIRESDHRKSQLEILPSLHLIMRCANQKDRLPCSE